MTTEHFSGICEPWLNSLCKEMMPYAPQRGYAVMASTTLVGMGMNDFASLEAIPLNRSNVNLPYAIAGHPIILPIPRLSGDNR